MHFVRVILACLRRRRDPEHAIPVMPASLTSARSPSPLTSRDGCPPPPFHSATSESAATTPAPSISASNGRIETTLSPSLLGAHRRKPQYQSYAFWASVIDNIYTHHLLPHRPRAAPSRCLQQHG